ncbi:hypothetical protein [Plantactinospora endophytica]|uniref:Uncharacterized protein n=1 Tax=Plantactinospora endophytica TaxID=673535 RepID=A0ABQ4EFH3_9ACTN|nr:hypothetical protein [Plantactinospora endophytica]GIG93410.1 hypothetical protein Pen02_83460 [Plantactinospora endophytica]
MAVEIWAAAMSLGGVAIGGGLSYVVQRTTQRMAAQIEQRKQDLALAESRRAERLAMLERFVDVGAEAERCAFSRPTQWQDGDAWPTRAQDVMNRFWVAERMIRLLFPIPVHDAARVYFLLLNGAVWQGAPEGQSVRDLLEEPRLNFLDAARAALE